MSCPHASVPFCQLPLFHLRVYLCKWASSWRRPLRGVCMRGKQWAFVLLSCLCHCHIHRILEWQKHLLLPCHPNANRSQTTLRVPHFMLYCVLHIDKWAKVVHTPTSKTHTNILTYAFSSQTDRLFVYIPFFILNS